MIIILHGADISNSRRELQKILQDSVDEKIYLDGKKADIPDIVLACETSPVIAENRIIIIENFFQRKESADKKKIRSYLFEIKFSGKIIFWENKEIDRVKIKALPKNTGIYKYEYDASLFKFLDSLGLQSKIQILKQFHTLLKNNDSQLIFSMLIRQFRFMLSVIDEKTNTAGIPDWQYYKFKKQSSYFSPEKLNKLYRQLLGIDYNIKSGGTPESLEELLDIFLVNL